MFRTNQKLLFLLAGLFLTAGLLTLTACTKKPPVVDNNGNINNNVTNNNQNNNQQTDLKDWKTYRNEELGFEFKYPKEWVLEEYDKNQYGSVLYVSDPNNFAVGDLNHTGDNIVVRHYETIQDEPHVKSLKNYNIKNLDDFLNFLKTDSEHRTETYFIKKEEEINNEKFSIIAFSGHLIADYALIIEKGNGIFVIVFESSTVKDFDNKDIKIKEVIGEKEKIVLDSFKFISQ